MVDNIMFSGILTTLIVYLFGIFLSPIIIAYIRKHNNCIPILLINITLGLTIIGYFVALVWSFSCNAKITCKDKTILSIYLFAIFLPNILIIFGLSIFL